MKTEEFYFSTPMRASHCGARELWVAVVPKRQYDRDKSFNGGSKEEARIAYALRKGYDFGKVSAAIFTPQRRMSKKQLTELLEEQLGMEYNPLLDGKLEAFIDDHSK